MTPQRGFTLVEALVGMVIGSMVMAAAYSLWRTHQVEGMRLSKKIELRNSLTLASKRLQRSVTIAGIGLSGAASLAKEDAVGSDTLTVFTNPEERSSALATPADHLVPAIQVVSPSVFRSGGYIAIVGTGHAELRRINRIQGSYIYLDSPFANDYPVAGSRTMPARRERYYSDQQGTRFLHEAPDGVSVVASQVKNFQVSFADSRGAPTTEAAKVRTVRFSLTGIYPAREGALNSIVISSTAIPRNLL